MRRLDLSFKNRSKLITCSGKGGIYLDEDGVQIVAIARIGDSKEIEKFLMKRSEAFTVPKITVEWEGHRMVQVRK